MIRNKYKKIGDAINASPNKVVYIPTLTTCIIPQLRRYDNEKSSCVW